MITLPKTSYQLARYIDHTILKPETTLEDVHRLCDECLEHRFFSACVNPYWVADVAERLADSETVVCSVAGFPLGATTPEQKAYEALECIEAGAREVDMVANIGALRDGKKEVVIRDIRAVVETVKDADPDALVKVIIESRALTEDQIILACRSVAEAQADFIKTSTGFHAAGGATVEHVALLRKHIAPIKVKASAGIRDLASTLAMIEAGADRIGTSAGVAILAAMEH